MPRIICERDDCNGMVADDILVIGDQTHELCGFHLETATRALYPTLYTLRKRL